jgi:hypothetical protein
MKPTNHLCLQCGFSLDPDNISEAVCPACGADPHAGRSLTQNLGLAAVLDDASASAETLQAAKDILDAGVSAEPEIAYSPDPDLDFVITDAAAVMESLTEGPIVVAGNRLVN